MLKSTLVVTQRVLNEPTIVVILYKRFRFSSPSTRHVYQPHPQGIFLKNGPTHFLREKPWGRDGKFTAEISQIEIERYWIHQSIGESDLLKKSFPLCLYTSSRLSVCTLQTAVTAPGV